MTEDDINTLKMGRLIFVPHAGAWLWETFSKDGRIFDYFELTAPGVIERVQRAVAENKRFFDYFEPEGAKPVNKDQIIAALRKAADELEAMEVGSG
jgi:hypothetical protein